MKKNLLNENTIRRFMKLANMQPLVDAFVREGFNTLARDEEPLEEVGEEPLEEPEEEPEEEPLEEPLEVPETEIPAAEEGGDVESVVKDVMATITQALNDKFGGEGLEINLETGEEGEEEFEAGEIEDMLPVEEEPPGEEEVEEVPEEELALENTEIVDDDSVVEEVLRRVARRLSKSK